MLPCFVCNEFFYSVNDYVSHLRVKHAQIYLSTKFSCTFQNCSRIFSDIENFRRHLKKHSSCEMKNNEKDSNINMNDQMEMEPRLNETDTESLDFDVNKITNALQNTTVANQKLEFLKLALNLLSDESLPRNKALNIMKKVSSTIQQTLRPLRDNLSTHLNDEFRTHNKNLDEFFFDVRTCLFS